MTRPNCSSQRAVSSITNVLASKEALFITENAVEQTNAKFRNDVTSVRWRTQQKLKTTAQATALSPRGRPRYLWRPLDLSHWVLRNSKEQHFLLFNQWESGSLVRSHETAQAIVPNVLEKSYTYHAPLSLSDSCCATNTQPTVAWQGFKLPSTHWSILASDQRYFVSKEILSNTSWYAPKLLENPDARTGFNGLLLRSPTAGLSEYNDICPFCQCAKKSWKITNLDKVSCGFLVAAKRSIEWEILLLRVTYKKPALLIHFC